MLKIDVSEDEEGLTITAELPGVEEQDFAVTVNDGILTIRNEKKNEEKPRLRLS